MKEAEDWSTRYCGDSNFGVKKLCEKRQGRLLIVAHTTQKQLHGQFIRQKMGKASENQ